MIRWRGCAMMVSLFVALSTAAAQGNSEEKYLAVVATSPAQLDRLADLSMTVFAVCEGIAFVEISAGEHLQLSEGGLNPVIVDVNPRLHTYYLLHVPESTITEVEKAATVLDYRNGSALLRASPGGAEEAARFGFGLTRLYPHDITRAREPRPMLRRSAGLEGESFLQSIADGVSEQEITASVRRLQEFQTRYSCTDSCQAAADYLCDRFAGFGLSVSCDSFPYDGSPCSGQIWRNVIAVHPGLVDTSQIYILCGHYDSINNRGDSWTVAPGADDNASGTAAVIEAARVLSGYDFDVSIFFICFSGEEQGLIGSYHYANWAFAQGLDIRGVINMDMIAYVDDPPNNTWDINLYGDSQSVDLTHFLADMVEQYSEAVPYEIIVANTQRGSDHYPFALKGYEAVFAIDAQLWSAPDWNPYYHSPADTLGTLDVEYATEVVRGVVAATASLAGTIGETDTQKPTMETIAEPQGCFYSKAPILSALEFNDDTAIDDGWYQLDSYTGTWQDLFTNASGTTWSVSRWTLPGFASVYDGSHTIYFKAKDDAGHMEGESGEWSWRFYKDTAAPAAPFVSSSSHPSESRWYAKDDVVLSWVEPYDLSGVIGYSFLLDQEPSTIPDETRDSTSRTFASTDLPDGVYYFHCRAGDNVCLWGLTEHFRIKVDTEPPAAPLHITVAPDGWTNIPAFILNWTDPQDLSGIEGIYYSIASPPLSAQDGIFTRKRPLSLLLALEGSCPVYVWLQDAAGNIDCTRRDSVYLHVDITPPQEGTLSIAGGADTTGALIVPLDRLGAYDALSGMGAGASMQFSNNGALWGSEEPLDSVRQAWDLSLYGGTEGSGLKQVFVRYRDVAGNWSDLFQDDIVCSLPLQGADGELASGTVGFAYACSLWAAGGWPPYLWRIFSGTLPSGLSLDSCGFISGLPDSAQVCHFGLVVTDLAGKTDSADASLHIEAQRRGDVNGDGHIDVVDVVQAIQIILETIDPLPAQRWGADCSGEGLVDIIDTVCIVNIILNGE